jgi:hypothetical protein
MNFDRLAPFYRAMEFFTAGGKLQRCRTALLGEIPTPARILLAGEGHGRTLQAMVEKFPEAKIVVVDSSAGMLQIAKRKTSSERIEFVLADLLTWQAPAGEFDLIVTNFFLDGFPPEELAVVVAKLGEMATQEAHWLLADFQVAEGKAAGLRSRVILAMLYAFFRVVCGLKARWLVPPDAEILKAGFSKHRRMTCDWGLLKSEWWRRG